MLSWREMVIIAVAPALPLNIAFSDFRLRILIPSSAINSSSGMMMSRRGEATSTLEITRVLPRSDYFTPSQPVFSSSPSVPDPFPDAESVPTESSLPSLVSSLNFSPKVCAALAIGGRLRW